MNTKRDQLLLLFSGILLLISLICTRIYSVILFMSHDTNVSSLLVYYLTISVPYLPLLLYCFFLRTKKRGSIAYLIALVLIILVALLDIVSLHILYAENEMLPQNYITFISVCTFLITYCLMIITHFTKSKVLSITIGVLLIINLGIQMLFVLWDAISILINPDFLFTLLNSIGDFLYCISLILFWIPVFLIKAFQKPAVEASAIEHSTPETPIKSKLF